MRTRPPTRFDAIRLRLDAAECFRRSGVAETTLAKTRLEELARELLRLAALAERGEQVPRPEEVASEVEAAAKSDRTGDVPEGAAPPRTPRSRG
jgi:hypothetical protein